VRFDGHKEDIDELLQEMLVGFDADAVINVNSLEALPWRCLPPRPAVVVDEKVLSAHRDYDEQRLQEKEIAAGDFEIHQDDGVSFKIVAKSAKQNNRPGWSFPRSLPTNQIWFNWKVIRLANEYLQANLQDSRFDEEVRSRVSRVLGYQALLAKTNFQEDASGLH
jgi:hypothetical protein